MKKGKKRFIKVLSVMLAVVLTLTAAPLSGFVGLELPEWLDFSILSSAATSGACGENVTWTFDESTGTLTISGTGSMYKYTKGASPWKKIADNIKKVVINSGVTTIGSSAFYRCYNLTSIAIPNSVSAIFGAAFEECYSIVSIKIPDSVTTIGDYAFSGCTSLTSVTIGDSVTTIGDGAFGSCTSLTSVTIGDSVTSIGDGAFGSCASLASVIIPDSVTIIGDYVFSGCTSLTSISIGDSVTSIGLGAFSTCGYYEDITNWESDVLYIGDYLIGAKKDIPDYYTIKAGTKTIADWAFSDCYRLKSIIIPNSVIAIGNFAFYECGSLMSITIPDSVMTIGSSAFSYTLYIRTDSNWSNDVLYINNHLISGSNNSTGSYTIKQGTKTIAGSAFRACDKLTDVIIPNSLVSIGEYAFYDSGLTSVTIPDSVTTIGSHAFYKCEGLTNVTIGNSITEIDDYTFFECTSLTSVTIGEDITTIGDYAFGWCAKLTSVTIPDGVTTIGNYAFDSCTSLTSVTIPDSVTTIGAYAFSGNSLKDVYYSGTEEQWNKISIDSLGKYSLTSATIHFNCIDDFEEPNMPQKYYILNREFENNLDYYAENLNSSSYNPTLANMMAALSKAIYDENYIWLATRSLGFTQHDVYDYDGTYNPITCGYSLSFKTSDYSDDVICLVTARGTNNLSDWIGNFSIDTLNDGKHGGFYHPSEFIYENISGWAEDNNVNLKNIKYFITGHSRGAAVANLLSVGLMERGVSSKNIYNYNFACPNVACEFSFTEYKNIFNLCNREDVVPFVPSTGLSIDSLIPGMSWGKYGQTYWFTKDDNTTLSPLEDHAMSLYLEFFDQQRYPEEWGTSFWDALDNAVGWSIGTVTKILCPVDVIITDKDGNKIASVINGETNYYDSNFGDVIIQTDGDKKLIFISGDADYNVELIGTDKGTMTYSVEKCNLANGEISESKIFEDVILEKGKTMYSPVSEAEETKDVQLYVTEEKDGERVYTNTINEDGTEEIYYNYNFNIQSPSRTEIRNKDGIVLHANVDGTVQNGSYIKWESSNGNFDKNVDGSNLKIIAKNKGWTTFTAILCDADGNELARDSVEMYSKSGFFDKIGGFFRSLFGTTKIYEN